MSPRSADVERMVWELTHYGSATTPWTDTSARGKKRASDRLHSAMTQARLRPAHTLRIFEHAGYLEGRVYAAAFEGRSLPPGQQPIPEQPKPDAGGKPSSPALCHCGQSLWLVESRGTPIRRHNDEFYQLSDFDHPRYFAECAEGHVTDRFSSPEAAMAAARSLMNGDA